MQQISDLALKKNINLSEIKQQIQKDLILSGIDTDFFDPIQSYDELASAMIHFVEELLNNRQDLFSNFIYRIDLPEDDLQKFSENDLQTNFAKLILGRIIQKIYFRKKFSK